MAHTHTCLRRVEGADIYHIAEGCRIRVGTIEKYRALRFKASQDAAAINVRRRR